MEEVSVLDGGQNRSVLIVSKKCPGSVISVFNMCDSLYVFQRVLEELCDKIRSRSGLSS